MTNPWLKKNPFMSMWLSGANVVMNTARAHAQRNATTMIPRSVEQTLRAWGWPAPARRKR